MKILDVFDHFGVGYKLTTRSIVCETCPSCGKKDKVWLFKPDERKHSYRTGGQCWSCGVKYSAYTYFVECGFEPDEVRKQLNIGLKAGADINADLWQIPDFGVSPEAITETQSFTEAEIPETFVRPQYWPTHPASRYARKRGVIKPIDDFVFIDPIKNAIAFPVIYQGQLAGFQRRYVEPSNPKIKTRTDPGVPRKSSLIVLGEESAPICVVEGPFDAVSAAWLGWQGVCTMGCVVTKEQAQSIAMMALDTSDSPFVYIGYDKDTEGEKGARELARLLDLYGIRFSRVYPKEGKDLNASTTSMFQSEVFPEIPRGIDKSKVVEIQNDWAWDLPLLPEFQFMEYSIGLKKSEVQPYREKDKTITNDFSWNHVRWPDRRKKLRMFKNVKKRK